MTQHNNPLLFYNIKPQLGYEGKILVKLLKFHENPIQSFRVVRAQFQCDGTCEEDNFYVWEEWKSPHLLQQI
jgi:hypothetical protein